MSLAEQWAWEALLASDGTDIGVVAQFEAMAPTGLKDRPRLRAFAALHWLRKVASGSEELSARVIDALSVLATLVRQHRSSGGGMFDEQYSTPSLLEPDMGLDLRVGFNLVLKKLQGQVYPGYQAEESPSDAFDKRHCYMWRLAGNYGKKIEKQFHELMTLNTPARHEQLPHAARELADTAEFADAEVLKDVKKFVEMATEGLGAVFLQELAKHAADDDLKGHGIIEQLEGRPRKQQRLSSDEGGPSSPRLEQASPEACGGAVAAALQCLKVVQNPVGVLQEWNYNGASNQRHVESVQAPEALVDGGLYLDDAPAAAGSALLSTPAGTRVAAPDAGGAGPSQPQQGRTVERVDTPAGEVPHPLMETQVQRQDCSEPDVGSPDNGVTPKPRRETTKWTEEEEDHLFRLVRQFGTGQWKQMLKSTRQGDTIRRRTGVDLKDKWRSLHKEPRSGKRRSRGGRNSSHLGQCGTPAALRLPPAEHAPAGAEEAAGNTALHRGNGAPAAAEANGGTAVVAAAAGGDGNRNGEPAGAGTVEGGMAGVGTAEADGG